jgi:hypothetical protein
LLLSTSSRFALLFSCSFGTSPCYYYMLPSLITTKTSCFDERI